MSYGVMECSASSYLYPVEPMMYDVIASYTSILNNSTTSLGLSSCILGIVNHYLSYISTRNEPESGK
jgi:hypothetical protein